VSEEAVIAACATVYDPEIPVNIYELGLIYAIEIEDDGRVRIEKHEHKVNTNTKRKERRKQ